MPASYEEGEVTEYGEDIWDLSNVKVGIYNLRVQNILTWGQPKLQSLTLDYDGELPVIEAVETINSDAFNNQAYDLLGRPVDDSYQGIVIIHGKKLLRISK